MVRELSHYVDGQRVAGTSGRFSDVFDPCTGEVQARVPLASADEVRKVIASAEKAQLEWGAMNPQRRGRIVLKFVDLVNEHLDELAALLSSEHGKTLPDAKGDIQRGIEVVEFAAGAARGGAPTCLPTAVGCCPRVSSAPPS
jgi:malonate-semialdehyde dehydrogenase (acetylating)/methylmalonate-semialdehyde dehydrogenase